MNTFITLYLSTLNREWRSKTIVALGVITVAMIFVVNGGMDLFIEFMKDQMQGTDVSQHKLSVFFFVIQSWATLLGVILGINTIASDSEGNLWLSLLAFPIPRWPYLLARLLGSTTIVMLYYVISLTLAAAIYKFSDGGLIDSKLFISLIPSLPLAMAVIMISAFVGMFFNRIVAFVGSLFLIAIINGANSYLGGLSFKELFIDFGVFKSVGVLIHLLFPRIGMISALVKEMVEGDKMTINPGLEISHFLITMGIWFFAFQWFFKRKEI